MNSLSGFSICSIREYYTFFSLACSLFPGLSAEESVPGNGFFAHGILCSMQESREKSAREVILDSINEGVFTVDVDRNVTSFNRAAGRITGVSREVAIGRR